MEPGWDPGQGEGKTRHKTENIGEEGQIFNEREEQV